MAGKIDNGWSRRERQIMQVLYLLGDATVADIVGALPNPPSDTAVRTFLRILETKGHVKRRRTGRKHVYRAARPRHRAAREALSNVLNVFFENSLSNALAAHLADPSVRLSESELKRLKVIIDEARKKGD